MTLLSSTYTLAIANGGALILTDGTTVYRVSDWSPGTKSVFGHTWLGGDWTSYGRLPAELRTESLKEQRARCARFPATEAVPQ